MLCEWCEVDSGLINTKRECCWLRMLANAPRHIQRQIGESLTAEQREELRPKLVAEKARLRKLRLETMR